MAWIGAGSWFFIIILELIVAILNAFQPTFLTFTYPIVFEYPHYVVYVTGIIGFVGFYGRHPTRTLAAGEFLISAGERIIAIVRTGKAVGRRSTDTAVLIPTGEQPIVITPPADVPVKVEGTEEPKP